MANYCTSAEVSVLTGVTYSDSSPTTAPTDTQVTAECTNITNEIDFNLSAVGITIQPTDTQVLGQLKVMATFGVAGRVLMSRYGGQGDIGIESSRGKVYWDIYKEYIKEIREHPELYGAETGDNIDLVSSQVLDGTISEDDHNDLMLQNEYTV